MREALACRGLERRVPKPEPEIATCDTCEKDCCEPHPTAGLSGDYEDGPAICCLCMDRLSGMNGERWDVDDFCDPCQARWQKERDEAASSDLALTKEGE